MKVLSKISNTVQTLSQCNHHELLSSQLIVHVTYTHHSLFENPSHARRLTSNSHSNF